MTRYSKPWLAAFTLLTSVFVGCTNDEDLGDRRAEGGSSPRGDYAARVVAACEASTDHRLNWVVDRASGSDMKKMQAPSGRCAKVAKCLDSASLDPVVAGKAVACLEQDTNKDAPKACNEDDVINASATRASVTAAQNACERKVVADCRGSYCGKPAIASDDVLQKYVACLDKPCGNDLEGCVSALIRTDYECIGTLFDPYPLQ